MIDERVKGEYMIEAMRTISQLCGDTEQGRFYKTKAERAKPIKLTSVRELFSEEEMQKHQPFGWIKSNVDNNLYSILAITSHGCLLTDRNIISFPHLCKYNTFADGTPVGIKYE